MKFFIAVVAFAACGSINVVVAQSNDNNCPAVVGSGGINCTASLQCCSGMFPICFDPAQAQCCEWYLAGGLCTPDQVCCGAGGPGASSYVTCCPAGSQCCSSYESMSAACCAVGTTCCGNNPPTCCTADEVCNAAMSTCTAIPTSSPAPSTAPYAWRVKTPYHLSSSIGWLQPVPLLPLVLDASRVVVPLQGSSGNHSGFVSLDVVTGAVLWNYTVDHCRALWTAPDGNRRHVYVAGPSNFTAIDTTTGEDAWTWSTGSLLSAYEDVVIVNSSTSAQINVLNASSGQELYAAPNADVFFAVYRGRNSVFWFTTTASGFDVARVDLHTKRTLWTVTVNNTVVYGSVATQVDWTRRELFVMSGAMVYTVLDVDTGTQKASYVSQALGWVSALRPEAPSDGSGGTALLALSGITGESWSAICAMNTSSLECKWTTYNSTCGVSGVGDWYPAMSMAYAGPDVVTTTGGSQECFHGFAASNGTALWTSPSNDTFLWATTGSFTAGRGKTTVVALNKYFGGNTASDCTVLALDAWTGQQVSAIDGFAGCMSMAVTDGGVAIVQSPDYVYGIVI
jgi:hypothetical protein